MNSNVIVNEITNTIIKEIPSLKDKIVICTYGNEDKPSKLGYKFLTNIEINIKKKAIGILVIKASQLEISIITESQ